MEDVNLLGKLTKRKHVVEAWKVIGEWEFLIETPTPEGLTKVKIKVLTDENGRYMAYPNIRVDGYIPIHIYSSVDEAVDVTLALVIEKLTQSDSPEIQPYEDY